MNIAKDSRFDVLLVDGTPGAYTDNPFTSGTLIDPVNPYYTAAYVMQLLTVNAQCYATSLSLWLHGSGDATVSVLRGTPDASASSSSILSLPVLASIDYDGSLLGADYQKVDFPLNIALPPGEYVILFHRVLATWAGMAAGSPYAQPAFSAVDLFSSPWRSLGSRLAFELNSANGISGTVNESLPLMLTEGGGSLGFSMQASSPFAGQLSQGQLREQDLTAYKVRTQEDWSGGRGLEHTDTPTNRFFDATADTRFQNMIVLPPKTNMAQALGSAGVTPSFVPGDGNTQNTAVVASGKWLTKNIAVPHIDPVTADAQSTLTLGSRYGLLPVSAYRQGDNPAQTVGSSDAYSGYGTQYVPGVEQIDTSVKYVCNVDKRDVQFNDALIIGQPVIARQAIAVTHVQVYCGGLNNSFYVDIHEDKYVMGDASGAPANATLFLLKPDLGPTTLGWHSFQVTDLNGNPATWTPTIGQRYWLRVYITAWHNLSDPFAWCGCATSAKYAEGQAKWQSLYGDGTWRPMGPDANGGPAAYAFAFKLNDGGSDQAGGYKEQLLAQSFTVGTTTTLNSITVFLAVKSWKGSPVVQFGIFSDSGGQPNSMLQLFTLAQADIGTVGSGFAIVTKTTSIVLNAGTYWLTLVPVAYTSADDVSISWQADTGSHYSTHGKLKLYPNGWTAGLDYFFSVDGLTLASNQYAQHFQTGPDAISVAEIRINTSTRTLLSGAAAGALVIYSDVAGSPGVSLGSAAFSILSQPVDNVYMGTLSSPLALSANTSYWLLIAISTPAYGDSGEIKLQTRIGATGASKQRTYTGGAWGAWSAVAPACDIYFRIRDPRSTTPGDVIIPDREQRTQLAMSVTPSLTVTLTKMLVYLKCTLWQGSPVVTLSIRSDLAGSPDATIANGSVTITKAMVDASGLTAALGWLVVAMPPTGAVMTVSTKYHIVLSVNATTVDDAAVFEWEGDSNALFPSGSAKSSAYDNGAWGGWRALSADLYFICNDGRALSNVISVPPVEYDGGLWICGGNILYRWNPATNVFDSKKTHGAVITAMASFNSKLWCALGDGQDMQASANPNAGSPTWAAVTGRKYTFLSVFNGYLYGLKATGGATALSYTDDGAGGWATDIVVGRSEIANTGITSFQDKMQIARSIGLWEVDSTYVIQKMRWDPDPTGGAGITVWLGNGLLQIPVGSSLIEWDGYQSKSVGLDVDAGLLPGETGKISAMYASRANWLFAAVDGGVSGRSSIWARSRDTNGWHCIVKATITGNRYQCLTVETSSRADGKPRLWYFEGPTAYYIDLPDKTDNFYQYVGAQYADQGNVISPWYFGELRQIPKDFQSIPVWSLGCGANQTVDVEIDVDRTGIWHKVGTINQSPYQELPLDAPSMSSKTLGPGCTDRVMVVSGGDTLSDIAAGSFVRINDEVGQVASIDSALQFTLALPLQSGSPPVGTAVYPSRPVGRMLRWRATLHTTNSNATPRVLSLSIRYQEKLIDKFRFNLVVRAEDRMVDRAKGRYPFTAIELRQALYIWIQRATPFWMVDPGGMAWQVKVVGASESGFTRQEEQSFAPVLKSTFTLQLLEV